jgi:hypothetical protein
MSRPRPLVLASAAAAAVLSLLAAGCGGGGGSPRVATVASTTSDTTTTSQSGLLAFSQCMRTHGVPSFPDPQQLAGAGFKLTIHQDTTSSPRARTAFSACNHLLPNTGGSEPQLTPKEIRTRVADGLSFAGCMRRHGVAAFPDPTAQGQLTVEMVQAAGIDVHSPAVLRVVQTCLPASHGALTPAKVREALANAGG